VIGRRGDRDLDRRKARGYGAGMLAKIGLFPHTSYRESTIGESTSREKQ